MLAVPVVWAFVEPLVPEFVPPEFVVRLRALVEPLVPEFVVPEFVAFIELSAFAESENFAG